MKEYYKIINWNAIEDYIDKMTYDKLTEQFWLATRMPVANDKQDWSSLEPMEKTLFERVFVGLALLDTLQSEDGVDSLRRSVRTQMETAVLNNIQFMESEHARYYSTVFSTLNTPKEIVDIFKWGHENQYLQKKALVLEDIYKNGNDLERKVASVFLESFLFYSGFYTPLRYLGMGKMINTAEGIKLIIRDEAVHGSYIGYKFEVGFKELAEDEQEKLKSWIYKLLYDLYENECRYTELLYDDLGWTEDVKKFLRYNANKSLNNLGLPSLFDDEADDINPIVMNGLSVGTNNHDFFSSVGNGYLMSTVESTKDSDYNI